LLPDAAALVVAADFNVAPYCAGSTIFQLNCDCTANRPGIGCTSSIGPFRIAYHPRLSPASGATNVSQTVTNAVVKTVTLQTANGVSGGTIATTTTAGELARKVYAAQGSLVFTFTPDADQGVSAFTAGKVRVYFRMFEFGR
jgi:hypothetical protein